MNNYSIKASQSYENFAISALKSFGNFDPWIIILNGRFLYLPKRSCFFKDWLTDPWRAVIVGLRGGVDPGVVATGAVDQLVLDDGDRLPRRVVARVSGKRQYKNENSMSERQNKIKLLVRLGHFAKTEFSVSFRYFRSPKIADFKDPYNDIDKLISLYSKNNELTS